MFFPYLSGSQTDLNSQSCTGDMRASVGDKGIQNSSSPLVKRTFFVVMSILGVARGVDFVGMGERQIDGFEDSSSNYIKAIVLDAASEQGVVAWTTGNPKRVVARLFSGRDPVDSNVYLTPAVSENLYGIALCPYRPSGSPPGFVMLRSVNNTGSPSYRSILAQRYVVNSTITPLGSALELTNITRHNYEFACIEFPKASGTLHTLLSIMTNPQVWNWMDAFDQKLISVGDQLNFDGAPSNLGIQSNAILPSITFASTETNPEKLMIVAAQGGNQGSDKTNGKLVDENFTTLNLISPILVPAGDTPSVAMNDEVAVVSAIRWDGFSTRIINVTTGVPVESQTFELNNSTLRYENSFMTAIPIGFVNWLIVSTPPSSYYKIYARLFDTQGKPQSSRDMVSCTTIIPYGATIATLPFSNGTILFYPGQIQGFYRVLFKEFYTYDLVNPQFDLYPNCDGSYPPEPTPEPSPVPPTSEPTPQPATYEPSPIPTGAPTNVNATTFLGGSSVSNTTLFSSLAPSTETNTNMNLIDSPRVEDTLVVAAVAGMVAFGACSLLMLGVLIRIWSGKKVSSQGLGAKGVNDLKSDQKVGSPDIELTDLGEEPASVMKSYPKANSLTGGTTFSAGFIPAQAKSQYQVFSPVLSDNTSYFSEPPAKQGEGRQKGETTPYFDPSPARVPGSGKTYEDTTTALQRQKAQYEDAASALNLGEKGVYFDEAPLRVVVEEEESASSGDVV